MFRAPELAVLETVEWSVIWDVVVLVWGHCNEPLLVLVLTELKFGFIEPQNLRLDQLDVSGPSFAVVGETHPIWNNKMMKIERALKIFQFQHYMFIVY